MHSVFVTGTDTGIGKTFVSCALLHALNRCGQVAVGMKPVASGCATTPDGLRNADALDLIAASSRKVDYGTVNPYAFGEAIAPHLAAADANVDVDLARIIAAHARLSALAPCVIVEGVGGWMAPLGATLMQADLVHALRMPVVLVVGMRLGCLNHALLTARAIEADGCTMIGWIANRIDADMLRSDDNIETLRQRIQAPLLGVVQHGCESMTASTGLDGAVDMLAAST